MSSAERGLVWLLRVEAVVLLAALPAVVMPTGWMQEIHGGLGMGELPRSPLVEYLTRSLSLLYATWGPVLFVLATDVRRHLPVIVVVSWVRLLFGLGLLLLDLWVGMPLVWKAAEGPIVVALSLLGLGLVWRVGRENGAEREGEGEG